jgi:prepilin-type N-terminal cleavage/methylation domain-containing protein
MVDMRALLARSRGADDGVTLVEVIVAMFLMSVISGLVVVGVAQASRVLTHNDDENRGLQDAKVIMERLSRDIREARAVTCDAPLTQTSPPRCADHLQLWIDTNSDYVEQPSEIVTWKVVPSTSGQHYDVLRIVGTGSSATTKVEATSLIVGAIFGYGGVQPEQASQVTIDLSYDAIINRGTSIRHAEFTAMLRNG